MDTCRDDDDDDDDDDGSILPCAFLGLVMIPATNYDLNELQAIQI